MRKFILIFSFLFSFLFSCLTIAVPNEDLLTAEPEPEREETWEQQMIRTNIQISNWFDRMAEEIDLFLSGRETSTKKNTTKIRFENVITSSEGQDVKNDFGISFLLGLPNVEDYWQVKFTSYDELNERRSSQRTYLRQNVREENYGASIGVFRKLGDVRVAFQPRVELQNPVKISHSLSFASTADMKTYIISPKVELYAVGDKGAGVYWSLNFDFKFNPIYSLTLINDGDYVSQTHIESVNNGFALTQALSDKHALSYGTLFFSNNRPVYHMEGYSLFTTWSQIIYKNIFDYQLTPHLDFAKDQRFRGRAGLALSLNFTF